MACRKCQTKGTITIKKDYSYCKSCYLLYINHKFRACIGKNKVISPNEKVLISLSGDAGSTVLLDLIHSGINLNTHKKLRIQPEFVHLTEDDSAQNISVDTIVKQCNFYGFSAHLISISKYMSTNVLPSYDKISLTNTSNNDFNKRMKQNVLASVAKDLQCRLIFTSESATSLAAKLLTDIVIGRGSQIENDIGFLDDKYDNIKILRPLRDITREELQHYMDVKGLIPMSDHQIQDSLHSVINSFVDTLEKEAPATISTICKTADKIGHFGPTYESQCVFCKGKLDKNVKKLTAIEATTFSRLVSNEQSDAEMDHIINLDPADIYDETIFPFIHQHLCYCCSRSYAERSGTNMEQHIKILISNKMNG